MMMMRCPCAALAVLILAACEPGGEPADPARTADSARAAAPATSLTGAPVADSARTASAPAPADAPVAAAQDSMLTPWETLEMPSEPWEQSAATPDAVLRRVRDVVAAQMEEPDASVFPTRMLSQAADSAVGLLVHPNLADDSIRDVEFRIHMRRDGSTWRVAGVDRRSRCRRGVAEGGLCA